MCLAELVPGLTNLQVWTAGQVIGLIHDIPSCDVLVKRIEKEAVDSIRKTSALFQDSQPASKL